MSSKTAYQYSAVEMEYVASNIDEYIIPENQKACQLLWSKNIFTVMCNNYDNDEFWITLGELDEDNQKIFEEMAKTNSHFGPTWGGRGLKVYIKPVPGADAYSEFAKLINLFAMQDVQKEGYMDKEEFLTYCCDCYKMVPNPDYKVPKMPVDTDYPDKATYLKAFDDYINHISMPHRIREFDESKMTKSFAEYLQESPYANFYDEDNERIYYNEFYYKAHLEYKKKMKVPKF